jgi:hypothetical protein
MSLKSFLQTHQTKYCPVLEWLLTVFGLVTGFIEHLYTILVTTSNHYRRKGLRTLKITVTAATMVYALTTRFLVTDLTSLPAGESPTTDSLLQLSTLESSHMLRRTVSRPVFLGIKHPSGAYDQIFITVRQLWVCWCGALSLTRGRVCRLQLLLASPAQSFSSPSPLGLAAIFYCLRFETSLFSPPTTLKATVEVFDHASTRDWRLSTNCHGYNISVRIAQKTPLLIVVVQSFLWEHVCLRSRFLATALVYICLSRGSFPGTSLHATIYFWNEWMIAETVCHCYSRTNSIVTCCAPAAATVQVLLLTPTCHVSWCPWQVINALV